MSETTPDRRWDQATFHADLGQLIEAAEVLADLVTDEPEVSAARLLLARAYFHSAQLRRAEDQARVLVEANPADGYGTCCSAVRWRGRAGTTRPPAR